MAPRCLPLFRPIALILLLLSMSLQRPAIAQAASPDPLARRVSLPATRAPLEQVLRELARRSGVSLSYSPTRLPLQMVVSVPAQQARPLREVLQTVLRDQPVAYALIDGQLVLWRNGDQPPVAPAGSSPASRAARPAPPRPASASPGASPAVSGKGAARPAAHPAAPRPGAPTGKGPRPVVRGSANSRAPGARRPATGARAGKPQASNANPANAPAPAVPPPGATASTSAGPALPPEPAPADSTRPKRSPAEAPARPASPLGTTLIEAAHKTGRALDEAAERIEQAIRTAVNSDSTQRQPAAGRTDSAATSAPSPPPVPAPAPASTPAPWERSPFQFSVVPPLSTNGLANARTVNQVSVNMLVGYAAGVDGVELGSLVNVARDSVRGFQAAGLLNATGNRLDGVQMAGLANLVAGGGDGLQAAGLLNVVTRPSRLTQAAGLVNLAPTEVQGVQLAGLMNVARKVHGVQLAGLLNIADSVDGVSLAPLSLVRKGYHRLEITGSETWPFNVSLKLGGSPLFYTYFTGAVHPFASRTRWAVGYGMGTELAARRRLSVAFDVQALQVNEDNRSWHTWSDGLNMHNQLRILLGWAPRRGQRLRVIAGPTFNVLVTERIDPLTGGPNSSLGVGQLAEATDVSVAGRTRVRGWIGFTGGLRF